MKVKKEFLGRFFTYTTKIDEDGNALWTQDIDKKFSKWLYQLKDGNRELFKVQYSISSTAYNILNRLKERIGVFDDSLMVRAITITFINFIDTKKGRNVSKKLRTYSDSSNFSILNEGELMKRNLYFSPVGMRDVEAYSNISELPKGKVIKNALYSVLLLSINEDEEIKRFWEHEILEQITTIIKAA